MLKTRLATVVSIFAVGLFAITCAKKIVFVHDVAQIVPVVRRSVGGALTSAGWYNWPS
jgi:hypothetical protein